MRVFAALVWREWIERRLLLLASAFLGIVPLVVPWLPGSPTSSQPGDVRLATTVLVTLLFGGAMLVGLGSTIVGRDLSEGRLGFYFSRPISAGMLWLARLVAASGLLFASILLMILPTILMDFWVVIEEFSRQSSSRAWPLLGLGEVYTLEGTMRTLPEVPHRLVRLGGLATILVTLLALVHALSTIVRGRSAWALADLGGLAVVVVLGWGARGVLVREEAIGALVWSEWLLVPWILLAGVLAGWVQIARGRTDLKLGHRTLSAVLWPMLILGALAFNGYAHFVAASRIGDLEEVIFIKSSPDDRWLVVGGRVQHRARSEAAFLLDTTSERSWRLGGLGVVRSSVAFSDDGSTVVWIHCEKVTESDCAVWAKDLQDVASAPRRTAVPIDGRPEQLVLSDDGSRLVYVSWRRLVIYEVASGNLLAALDVIQPPRINFFSRDQLRFFEFADESSYGSLRIQGFDLRDRQLTEIGTIPRGYWVFHSPRDQRVVYTQASPNGYGLYDSERGEPLGELHPGPPLPSDALFLADGRTLLIARDDFNASLSVLSTSGEQEVAAIEAPKALVGVRVGGEVSPGRVLIAFNEVIGDTLPTPETPGLLPDRAWTTYLFDVDTHTLEVMAAGLRPLGVPLEMPADRLFMATGQTIVRRNLESGEQKTLVGPLEVGD